MATSWLSSLHHDGSAKYVSNLTPRLGERVRLRLRVSPQAPVRRVALRTYPDCEPLFTPLAPGPLEPACRWWDCGLQIDQPTVHYRFLIDTKSGLFFVSFVYFVVKNDRWLSKYDKS